MKKVLKIIIPLILVGAAVVALVRVPTHPGLHDANTAAIRIAAETDERRWDETFHYGELSGDRPLDEVAERARALPSGLRQVFLDGYGHALDPDDAMAFGDALVATFEPGDLPFLHDGVIQSIGRRAESPADAVLRAEAYAARHSVSASNGLRIALQRQHGDDMERALELGSAYPSAYHVAVFEELGWRVGHEDLWDTGRLERLAVHVPPDAQCAFRRGADRGLALQVGGWQSAEEWTRFRDRAQGVCRDDRMVGLGHALLILYQESPRRDAMLALVASDERQLLESALYSELGR